MAGYSDGREVPPLYGYGYPFPVYRTQASADHLQQFFFCAPPMPWTQSCHQLHVSNSADFFSSRDFKYGTESTKSMQQKKTTSCVHLCHELNSPSMKFMNSIKMLYLNLKTWK